MESVDVMAGAGAATSGRPLIEIIDEGQVDLSSDGIDSPIKRAGLLQWLSPPSCDSVCLQETRATDTAEATSWFSSSGFLTVTAPGTAHSRGQVLLYCPSFSFVNSWVELEGRFLMAEFSRRGSFFRISSVYAPNRTPSATNSLP
ncbi:unnamed protein product, partial [Porites lobata]